MHKSIVDKFSAVWADLLAPLRCHCCGGATGGPVCAACEKSLPWNTSACRGCAIPLTSGHQENNVCGACLTQAPPQDRSWAAFRYEAPVSRQIVGLKFHGDLMPSHVLGCLMAARLATRPEPLPELLIPVPLHRARLQRRGYNQAQEIARVLSRRLGMKLRPDAARRLKPTREQTELHAADRRRNVRGVFAVSPDVAGRRIALLDDVITTGATVAELARTARKAGAAHIEVWAAARA
jgi:ComF family protein